MRCGHTGQMASDHPPEGWPGGLSGSRSCSTEAHADCGHLASIGYGFWNGGGPAPLLCQCVCHSACPLVGRLPFVSRATWEAQCTCPGTELAAGRLDQAERNAPDFSDFERQWQERWEGSPRDPWQLRVAKREALEAARAAGAGRSRAQIREIYVAELRARGLRVPSDLMLDATADAIARNSDGFSLVYKVRLLAEAGQQLRNLFSGSDPGR
jgi:hypothetical protein